MCLAQGPQRSDAGEARTRGPSVLSQALYHWATALPQVEYASVVWSPYTKDNINKIEKVREGQPDGSQLTTLHIVA